MDLRHQSSQEHRAATVRNHVTSHPRRSVTLPVVGKTIPIAAMVMAIVVGLTRLEGRRTNYNSSLWQVQTLI